MITVHGNLAGQASSGTDPGTAGTGPAQGGLERAGT